MLGIVIVTGAAYSYKQVDFGGKTSIFFRILFGDQDLMKRVPPKAPFQEGKAGFKPPEGFKGGHDGSPGARPGGQHGPPPGGKGIHGKPGTGKIISLRNVIPYFFILAFFIMITRILDVSIRKASRTRA